MPILTLKFKGKTLDQFYLKKDKSMTIGRADDNDIVVPNLAASGYHAKIEHVDGAWLLTDLDSTNGTFINDAAVSTVRLAHHDRINIVKHTLVFAYMKGEHRPDDGDAAEKPIRAHTMGVLAYLSGGGGDILLDKNRMLIGKDPSADIVVSGMGVGSITAAITRQADRYLLSYEGGLSRVRVNGKAVKEPVWLEELDEIEMGPVKLRFYIK